MDDTLSSFVDQTGCDPSFARDLLEGKKWDLDEAMKAFKEFSLGSDTRSTKTGDSRVVNKPQRGISVVNSDIVLKARTRVLERDCPGDSSKSESFKDVAKYTFVLPELSSFTQEFGEFLRKDLTETSALVALEQSGHLNWWTDIAICQRIVPLATVGDGNCLLHAASLGMWGFHDRLLTLRKALLRTLVDHPASDTINRRWRLQQYQKNMEAGGLVYTEEEWKKEWEEVVRLASTNRRKIYSSGSKSLEQPISTTSDGQSSEPKEMDVEKKGLTESDPLLAENSNSSANKENEKSCTENVEPSESIIEEKEKASGSKESVETEDSEGAFESLEDIHVFVLAHVLRRPIIIIADKYLRDFSGDPIAPIPFGGIYLPFECPPQTCHKTPLVLVFESAHFSAAVVSDEKNKQTKLVAGIPVVDHDFSMLPLHFSVDPGENFDWIALNDETQLPAKLTLNADKKLDLLEKYLNIAHIRIPHSAKKEAPVARKDTSQLEKGPSGETDKKGKKEGSQNGEGKELSWSNNPITNKVGEFAGKIKKLVDTSTVCIAKIQTNEKPEYYDEMISNYIQSAKKRFEEKKQQTQEQQNLQGTTNHNSQPCITPGCSMYGTADRSYLCSSCYKAQKSASQSGSYKSSSSNTNETGSTFKSYLPPASLSSCVPYDYFTSGASTTPSSRTPTIPPPSYSEVCQRAVELKTDKVTKCHGDGCDFYGSPERNGYCSSCFKKQTTNL